MHHISTSLPDAIRSRGGGRISSPAYRRSLALCDDFTGLQSDESRYDLLKLAKRVGKAAGFTTHNLALLEYYLSCFTRDEDWRAGQRPIVYQAIAKTAMDLGVTERQVQHLEQQLFQIGALTWRDSGNHRRYGYRDPVTGTITHAFGADLTPLGHMRGELERKLAEKKLTEEAWFVVKRSISGMRRQLRALLQEAFVRGEGSSQWLAFEAAYQRIAGHIRTYHSLAELQDLLKTHQQLHADILAALSETQPEQTTAAAAIDFAQIYIWNQEPLTCRPKAEGFQKSVAAPTDQAGAIYASGLQHVSLQHVLQSASDRFRGCLPLEPRPLNWQDVSEAAWRLRPTLHISQKSWGEACEILGRAGAALCLLITDQAALRADDPVAKPAAYFRGLLKRAERGELHLHSSIFGLIERRSSGGEG